MNGREKILRYHAEAANFNEALPIGNGRLGAMVYSGVKRDKFSLNEDKLWAGTSAPAPREKAREAFGRARELLLSGDRRAAQNLIESDIAGPFVQPYLPAGNLWLEHEFEEEVIEYERGLDLSKALAFSRVKTKSASWTKESFSSTPDDAIIVRLAAQNGVLPETIVRMDGQLPHKSWVEGASLTMRGLQPENVRWHGVDNLATPTNFAQYGEASEQCFVVVNIASHDGVLENLENAFKISIAREIVLHISIETSAAKPEPLKVAKSHLLALAYSDFNTLKTRHIEDYQQLFSSVDLVLWGGENRPEEAADTWLQRAAKGAHCPALYERFFDMSRYLLIASSRAGTMPANLQGIWNEWIDPPWWSNYTININLQMNYWAAEISGLGECHLPLFDFLERLAKAGESTAREMYGARGWVVHHQTDFHCQTTPVGYLPHQIWKGSCKWLMWPMGGPWLTLHTLEHYKYSQDKKFLERMYPVIRGAALFLCDWLIDDPQNPDCLTTAPSTSPENSFIAEDGEPASLCKGSTMDIAIARAQWEATLEVIEILGIEDEIVGEISAKLPRLPNHRYARDGRILEFDQDYAEAEAPHRHISHLFDLCPGEKIRPWRDPKAALGALKALQFRGDTGTGWSLVWKARAYARLGLGDKAVELLRQLTTPISSDIFETADDGGGAYPNFLTACPPMMIESSLGFGAALMDLFVQCEGNNVHLLPAVPRAFASGEIRGLCLPNLTRLDLHWKEAQLEYLVITSECNHSLVLHDQDQALEIRLKSNESISLSAVDFARPAKRIGS